MKQLALIILMAAILCSCSKKEKMQPQIKIQDTIVAKTERKSDYYTRIINYHLIIKGDTSKTGIVIFQNEKGKLSAGLGLGKTSRIARQIETKPYRLRYLEVKKLMQEAGKDVDMKSLEEIGPGFLMETGDLAIDVSREYFNRYGSPGAITWHQIGPKKREQIEDVLLTSRIAQDLNTLLSPFGKKIDRVTRAEQLMFAPKRALDYYTIYETDPSQVPEFIMDAGLDFSVVDK